MRLMKKMLKTLIITVSFMEIWTSATSCLTKLTGWWMSMTPTRFKEASSSGMFLELFSQALCYKMQECQMKENLFQKPTIKSFLNGLLKDINQWLERGQWTEKDWKEWFCWTRNSMFSLLKRPCKKETCQLE